MLAPVGAILLVAELRKNPSATWWVLDATVVALLAALPILTVMAGHIEEYYGTAAACLGDQVWCVADDGTATVASLFRLTPDSTPSFLRFTSFSAAFWLAAPAILLSANRRRWVLCSAFALGLLFLSLGPCASWTLDSGDLNGVHASSSGWAAVWCALQRIHRPERFAMVAAGVLLTGMALGLQQASTRGVRARQVACLVAALSVLHSGWLLMGSVTQAASWKAPPEVRDSADLANQPASVIAALPFDGTYEYLAAMLQPQHYWVNSYQPERRTHTSHVAIRWLQRVGLGDLDAPTPTNADWRSAGVNAVTYSPDRCGTAVIQPISRCFYDLPATLKAALGPPTQTDGRNMMWTLQPDPGAAAARTTMCGTNGEGELEFAPAFGKRESP
jgi:hypothetical protein